MCRDVHEVLEPVVQALIRGLGDDLVAIVLFGSRARRQASPESDWDLLVVARRLPETALKRHFFLKSLLPDEWRGIVSILARTPEEFEAHLPTLYLEIALDGIVLYDIESYMTKRLAKLRAAITRLGLERQIAGKETLWRWSEPPPPKWAIEWETVL